METLKQAINKKKITIVNQYVDSNPNMSDMMPGSTHYKSTLKKPGKQITVYFSQGPAHYAEPDPCDVLSCLLSDASCLLSSNSVADFANEFGYTNFLKAERVYNTIEKQTEKLKRFLDADFDHFMYNVEPY